MSRQQSAPADLAPPLSLLFAYGVAATFPVLALLKWVAGLTQAVLIGQVWGAAILIFLAGVTRGLSFFTAGGPRWSQICVMAMRFWLGLSASLCAVKPALLLLVLGYVVVAVSDVALAKSGGAPSYFKRLRLGQTAVILAGLLGLLASI
jgi:hypothetical protein